MKKFLAILFASLGLAVFVGACGGDDSEDGDQGPVVVYSGRDEELVAPLFEQFTEDSGIEVEARYGDSAEMAATILDEGDNSPATVFFSQDAGALGALQQEDLLTELPDEILDRVPERFRSPEGGWVGVSGRARVVAYNTDRVDAAELPSTTEEMADSAWKGRFGWVPDNASFQAFVTAMRLVEGDQAARDWLEAMVANDTRAYPGNSELRDAVAAGEIDAGITNHYYIAQAKDEGNEEFKGANYPVDMNFTEAGDPAGLVNVTGAGILSSSDAGAAGEQLIEFLLRDSSQQFFADETMEYPLVDGVAVDESLVPLDEIESPDIDLTDLDDLETTLEMIQQSGAL